MVINSSKDTVVFSFPLSIFKIITIFFIEVELIYSVMLVSGV